MRNINLPPTPLSRRDTLRLLSIMSATILVASCVPEGVANSRNSNLEELLGLGELVPEYEDSESKGYNTLVDLGNIQQLIGNEFGTLFPNVTDGVAGCMAMVEEGSGLVTGVIHPIATNDFAVVSESSQSGLRTFSVNDMFNMGQSGKDRIIDSVMPLKGGSLCVLSRDSDDVMTLLTQTNKPNLDARFRSEGQISSDRRVIMIDRNTVYLTGYGSVEQHNLRDLDERVRAKNTLFVNRDEQLTIIAKDSIIYPVTRHGGGRIVLAIDSLNPYGPANHDVALTMTHQKLESIALPIRHVTNQIELKHLGMDSVEGNKVNAAIYLGDPGGVVYPWVQFTDRQVYEHTATFE